jgi:hypothetical protein
VVLLEKGKNTEEDQIKKGNGATVQSADVAVQSAHTAVICNFRITAPYLLLVKQSPP